MRVVGLCLLISSASAFFTANVYIVNFLKKPLIFKDCVTSVNGTLVTAPTSVAPGQVTRMFVNTTEKFEDVAGYCWFEADGYGHDCHPPAPVKGCPWIGWQREVVLGQETIDWEAETPGEVGIGDVTLTKIVTHESKQYCFCEPTIDDCQRLCKEN